MSIQEEVNFYTLIFSVCIFYPLRFTPQLLRVALVSEHMHLALSWSWHLGVEPYTWMDLHHVEADLFKRTLLISWCEHVNVLWEKLTSSLQCASWHLGAPARTSKRELEKLCTQRRAWRVNILERTQRCSSKCRAYETCPWKVDISSCKHEHALE